MSYNPYLNCKTYEKLYESFVIPIMDNCSGVWDYKCKTIQNRAIRSFLGVHRFTSNVVVNGDIGWKTPNLRHKICMNKLWNRFVKMSDNRLTKKVLLIDEIGHMKLNIFYRHVITLNTMIFVCHVKMY